MNDAMWQVPLGLDADFYVDVLDEAGDPMVFTGAEPFTVWMWQGDDLAPVTGVLSATWTNGNPSGGTFVASVSGAAVTTAALTSDYYLTRFAITLATGRLYSAYEGWLNLQDAPGTAVVPTVYCTLQDMLDVGGDWLTGLMQEGGRTSFLADRARATRKFDEIILSRSRPMTYGYNYGAWGLYNYGYNYGSPEQPDPYVAGLLANHQLIVTDDIRECVAYLAASLACERSMTWDGNDPHAKRAAYYRQKHRARLSCLSVGIDVNADGVADLWYNLGRFSQR